MRIWQTRQSHSGAVETTTARLPEPSSSTSAQRTHVYHPSAELRRLLNKQTDEIAPRTDCTEAQPGRRATTGHAPGVLSLVCGGIAVGALSGTLELTVQAVQVRILHRVDWSTLMISRHVSWMAVVVASALTPCLTV